MLKHASWCWGCFEWNTFLAPLQQDRLSNTLLRTVLQCILLGCCACRILVSASEAPPTNWLCFHMVHLLGRWFASVQWNYHHSSLMSTRRLCPETRMQLNVNVNQKKPPNPIKGKNSSFPIEQTSKIKLTKTLTNDVKMNENFNIRKRLKNRFR